MDIEKEQTIGADDKEQQVAEEEEDVNQHDDNKHDKRRVQIGQRLKKIACRGIVGITVAALLSFSLTLRYGVMPEWLFEIVYDNVDDVTAEYMHDIQQAKPLVGRMIAEQPAFRVLDSITEHKILLKEPKDAFIMYFFNWCAHSKKCVTEWQKFARESGANITVAAIECTEKEKEFGIHASPTFLYYHNGRVVGKYGGDRTAASFRSFTAAMRKTAAANPADLAALPDILPNDPYFEKLSTLESYHQFVQRHKNAFILLYSRENSFSKAFMIEWNALAKQAR